MSLSQDETKKKKVNPRQPTAKFMTVTTICTICQTREQHDFQTDDIEQISKRSINVQLMSL